MRSLTILLTCIIAGCAEDARPAPTTGTIGPVTNVPTTNVGPVAGGPVAVAAPPHLVTADDLGNLIACARRTLPSLSPEEIGAMAVSIKHAEADLQILRLAAAGPPPKPAEKPDDKK